MSDSLRDVPFQLSKKFYPLSRPQFREIDIHIPSLDALEDEYDFSRERRMIVKHDAFFEEKERLRVEYEKKLAEQQRREEEERIEEERRQKELAEQAAAEAAEEAEKITQLLIERATVGEVPADTDADVKQEVEESDSAEEPVDSGQSSDDQEKTEQNEQQLQQPSEPSPSTTTQVEPPIVLPQRQEPIPFATAESRTNHKPSAPETPAVPPNNVPRKIAVRLSDFEADTANPFDSVELKSMNDKAELASIWGKLQQDQQLAQAYLASKSNSTSPSPSTVNPYAPPWDAGTTAVRNPNGSSSYHYQVPIPQSCSPVPASAPSQQPMNNAVRTNNSNQVVSAPSSVTATSTIESSLNEGSRRIPTGTLSHSQLNHSVVPTPTNVSVSSSSSSSTNSFTKLHFPFLTSYTQAGARDRLLERELDRSYYQQHRFISSSPVPATAPPPPAVGVRPNVGSFNPTSAVPPPSLPSSSSASNLQAIPNPFAMDVTSSTIAAAGVNSSHHHLANQAHNNSNFILGHHNYNWPLTTTHTHKPPYEYLQQQPTKKS